MFVGREQELQQLEQLYHTDDFQMLIVYGRRRVGKTTLLQHFLEGKQACFFAAQEANDKINLENFSARTHAYFGHTGNAAYASWNDAIDCWLEASENQRHVLVIDEFPYACEANPGLQSILQNAIDHRGLHTKLFLILCGSQVSFMENEVMGHKSPLFGRRTAAMKLEPFDYYDAAKMLPGCSPKEAIQYYSCIGGTPYYLSMVDMRLSFRQNIERLMFQKTGFLYEEPILLLKQELREPSIYNSIMTAIAGSANKLNEIALRLGEDRTKLGRYLTTLINLDLIEKVVPFGEDQEKSKKGIYRIKDNFYQFWYRNVFNNCSEIESGTGKYVAAAMLTEDNLNHYIGKECFEKIALEYLKRKNQAETLPFPVTSFGKWWGNDSVLKMQSDIDIVAANKFTGQVILGECKWRNEAAEAENIQRLLEKSRLLPGYREYRYLFFSQSGWRVGDEVLTRVGEAIELVTVDDLWNVE